MIPSFSVDHRAIVPGIFVSRVDTVGGGQVTTYDIRLKRPNIEPVIDVAAMHSLEHLIATYLRNDPDWQDEVIYWGPMGCLTGFYLILKGSRAPQELFALMLNAFRAVADAQEVPGAAPVNCGHGQVVCKGICRLSRGECRKQRDFCLSNDGAARHGRRTAFLRFVSRPQY